MLEFKSLPDLLETFKTEEYCVRYLEKMQWNGNISCKHCGCDKIYIIKQCQYKCKQCRKQFNVKTGTIFQATKITLKKWFIAMYLCNVNNKVPNSQSLSDILGITYKSAWYLSQRLRTIFQYETHSEVLQGEVEMDEAIFYGANKNKHYHKRDKLKGNGRGIIPGKRYGIFGMVQRGGRVIAMRLNELSSISLGEKISQYIDKGSTVYTDNYDAYGIACKGYDRKTVNHSIYQYVDGNTHTNTIEGFWGHMKRTIKGLNHWVSEKHIDLYVSQICWFYNTKHLTPSQRFNYFLRWTDKRITYKQLIK